MYRHSFLIPIFALVAVVFIACRSVEAEPTEIPPTATAIPISTPSIRIITESPETDFESFLSQIPEEDLKCFSTKLGEDRMKALALGEIDLNDEENTAIQGCFSNEFVVGFLAGQIQRELGGFSGSSADCAASLLDEIPPGVLTKLMVSNGNDDSHESQLAIQGFTECLTREELAVLTGSNADDANSGTGTGAQRYSSLDEQCMVGELGQSFADGYGELLNGGLLSGFSNAIEICGIDIDAEGMVAHIEDTERRYRIADLESVGFKKSKTYDVKNLPEASSVHYGFYGIDPYNRLDYEARFYFSNESAKNAGVEFANHATGAGAVLYEDDQPWTEGLTERRRCDSSGGHHVGRCGFPKYFDYVVAGNMVLMCEGKDTLESLRACADLLGVIE